MLRFPVTDCPTSTLEQLKTVPSQLQDESVSRVSSVRSTSNDLVQEADFLLGELSGINDTAVEYLCRAPAVDDWYYDLSSHQSPPAEHQLMDNTEDAFMLREISQKIRNYQVNSESIVSKKKYGNQNQITSVTPAETQKLHRSPQPQEAVANQSSSKFTTICPTPNSSTISIHPTTVSAIHPTPVSTIHPTPVSTTISIHSTPVSTVCSTPVSTVRSTRLSTIRSTFRPTRLSTIHPTPVSTTISIHSTPVSTVCSTPVSTVRSTRLSTIRSTFRPTRLSTIRSTPLSTVRPTRSSTIRPTALSTVRPTPVSSIRQTSVSTVRPTPVSTFRPIPVSSICPTPASSVRPTPVSTVRPTPVSSICATPVSSVRLTPVSTVRSTQVSSIRSTPVTTVRPTPVSSIRPTPVSVKTKEQIISNHQRDNSSHNPQDIFMEIEDAVWDLSQIRHCHSNPGDSEQEEAMDLSTVQYNDVLNARYEMITPPCEEITEMCKTSSINSQYEAVSPPAQEVPHSPRLGRDFATASPCFFETQSKIFPPHHISGSKKCTYRSFNPKPHAANFPQRNLDNHFVVQNRTLGFPYYSYLHIYPGFYETYCQKTFL